jgi:hypothetical protein
MTSFWHCALRSQANRLPWQATGGMPERTRTRQRYNKHPRGGLIQF